MDVAFDTLAVTRQLKAKGFDSDQAEAITEAVRSGVTGGVATRADLSETESRLRGELTDMRGDVNGRLARVEVDLVWIKRIGGVIVALLAVPLLRDLLSALN